MKTPTTNEAVTTDSDRHQRPAAIVLRSVLALLVCALAWLCVSTALATERAGRVFRELFRNAAPPDLSGFFWQHPHLLLGFAVVIAIAALLCLALCKAQRLAVASASLVLGLLLLQWLVVTPSVGSSASRMMQKAAQEIPK